MASPSSPSSPGGDVQAKAGFTTNVTDPLSHVIGMETTSDALAEDSLATLDALMRDPLRESLESIVASSEPRNRSDSDPMDIDMMREGPVVEERLKKLVMMGQIDKTVAKKWLQTKLRQKVSGAREKRRGKRRRRIALRRLKRSKRRLARLIRKLRRRLRRKPRRIRRKIRLRIQELREALNNSKRIRKEVQKSSDPMTRVVLSKEERKAKRAWQRKLGTRVDVQTWRASSTFKKWLEMMEAGYHPNDNSRSWMAERGNLENNATEEDQKDIAAKMPGGNIKPVVPSTTSYRVRVRTTGIPQRVEFLQKLFLCLVVEVVAMEYGTGGA